MTALENALFELARKAAHEPYYLSTADFEKLAGLCGEAQALEYAQVMGEFHFTNRIADLLHVDQEIPARRVKWIRNAAVRIGAFIFSKLDLDNRAYDQPAEKYLPLLVADLQDALGVDLSESLQKIACRPAILEILYRDLTELLRYSTLPPTVIAQVFDVVADSLAKSKEDISGILHSRPDEPVALFAFVGTRYANRTTESMIDSLREAGYDDVGILDLAIAVSIANKWVRQFRVMGIPALATPQWQLPATQAC